MTLQRPRFSIVTVCRNAGAQIGGARDSLQRQDFTDYEWIVVDGASTDDTLQVCEGFSGPRGRWMSEPDKGIFDAMNKGIGLATGDYVYFLNADDRLFDSSVLGRVDAALRSRQVDVLYGNVLYVGADENTLRTFSHIDRRTLPFEDLCHQAVFASRSVFERVGAFNTAYRLNADYDWLLRVFAARTTFAWADLMVAKFDTGGAHGLDRGKLEAERLQVRLQYMTSFQWRAGDLRRRVRHRLHQMIHGHRPGRRVLAEAPL